MAGPALGREIRAGVQFAVLAIVGLPLLPTGPYFGVVAASMVLIPRVVIVSGVLNSSVALALLPLLAPAFVAGLSLATIGWHSKDSESTIDRKDTNPLRLGAAIRMALAFQIAIVLIGIVRTRWGTPGVYTTAAMLGLTDVDALTVSMSRPDDELPADVASRAIAIGILANTALKMAIALTFGRYAFRRRPGASLAAMVAASTLGLLLA